MAAVHVAAAVCLLATTFHAGSSVPPPSAEKKLIKYLLENYDRIGGPLSRPVTNDSAVMNVKFGMALIRIDDYKKTENGYLLTLVTFDRYMWDDAFLTWDPAEHGGVTSLHVPSSRMWRPDLLMFNAGPSDRYHGEHTLAIAYSSGTVLWIPRSHTKVHCITENKGFFSPDEIVCKFKFGSWTYDGFQFDPNFYDDLTEIDLSDYVRSDVFEVLKTEAEKHVKYYPCCTEPYPLLTFKLTLRLV